ncbi:hypothetical protein QD55_004372, partial [Salmonella enterica subsp. enterica serovar Ohio]|nr:hypothetical protein [Salmonella enterica subsp. enterica serovar Ohio]
TNKIKTTNTNFIVYKKDCYLVYSIHQQDALLTRTVDIQRFSDESTRLKSRNDQSELWESVSWSLGLVINRAGLRSDLKSGN